MTISLSSLASSLPPLPLARDDDQAAIRKKKPRQKKDQDKWSQLFFVPMPVLNRSEVSYGGKKGKREGFNTFNRLACKSCTRAFHTTMGRSSHSCSSSSSSSRTYSTPRTSSTPRSSSTKPRSPIVMGSRRSTRAAREIRYQDDDDIEIVGDTEMDKKNAAKIDKNFGKMTMKGKLEAIEAFRLSSQYDEEEEEGVVKAKTTRNRRKKQVVEDESDSDIEVLDSDSDSKKGDDSDDEIEVLDERPEEMQKPQTKLSSLRKRSSPGGEERLLQEDTDKPKKAKVESKSASDYVQVKSASGKTMMVERSKLASLMARQEGAARKVVEAPEEILLAEDSEEEEEGLVEETRVTKRLQEVGGGPSKRQRRHQG